MLHEMKQIALDYLFNKLNENKETEMNNLEWYIKLCNNEPTKLIKYFVESVSGIDLVFILIPDNEDGDLVNLTVEEITDTNVNYLPFIKPSGSQSGQIGPVIKRSFDKKNGVGPSDKILKTTQNNWQTISDENSNAGDYFTDILNILKRGKLNILNEKIVDIETNNGSNILITAIKEIKSNKTSIVAVRNSKGELPGESSAYSEYLQQINSNKYITGKTPPIENQSCSLCNTANITVYSNGVKGAGINIGNVDRDGSFSELNLKNAWKNYAICQTCADLLYVYKNHVLKTDPITKKRIYQTYVAGEKALIIPTIANDPKNRQKIMKRMMRTIKKAETNVDTVERRLWNVLKEEKAILNINIYG